MNKKDLVSLDTTERIIENKLKELIQDAIGQSPSNVSCTFVGKSDLAILIEDIETPLDEFLRCCCPSETVQQYRKGMELAISNRVQKLIEQTTKRPVDKVSMSHQTATKWMGIFILL